MPERESIPTLIHQSWRGAGTPSQRQKWADSWRFYHPMWEHRLWTDADGRSFLEEHYPWFLPIYNGYPDPIMRADAIRYFVLDHFGGLYVDLDVECLRPVRQLLAGRDLLLGLEPSSHARLSAARRRGLASIVGHAFIASRPGHPFWAHTHRELVRTHRLPNAPDVSGPFFLTRAWQSAPTLTSPPLVVGPELLYPKVGPYAKELFTPPKATLDQAYAVYHGAGSWASEESWAPRPSATASL